MRNDSIGLFWEDVPRERGKDKRPRVMPPIPDTGWTPPKDYPNLRTARALSIDLETYDPELDDHGPGWARGKGHIVGFSVGTDDGHAWYFPIRHTIEKETNLDPEKSLRWLNDMMGDKNQPKVGANLLYDYGWLKHEGITVLGELVDVEFAEALLEERARVSLEELGQKYLKRGKETELVYKWCADFYGGKPNSDQRKNLWRAPPRLVGPYGEGDATLPIQIAPFLYERLWREGMIDLFKLECGQIPLLVAMRMAGVSVDLQKAELVHADLQKRIKIAYTDLDKIAGRKVEINSADSVAKAFDHFGLKYKRTAPSKSKPKGSPSFTKEFLKTVGHPLAKQILEIRRLEKFDTTFVQGYILDGHVNGKIYCSFHPLRGDDGGTRSGRYSSSDPNLQNIPVRDEELGELIRSIFIPDSGHVRWRKFDYSQIEFRILVHYAVGRGAEEARERYRRDPTTDYHKMVQKIMEELTHRAWDRRPIKNLNFGKVYGMGDEKAGASTGLTGKALQELLKAYDTAIPFAKSTMSATMDEANIKGYITTLLNRRSRFDLWELAEWGTESKALPYEQALYLYKKVRRAYIHKALNRRLQGSAADMIKKAMYKCWVDGVYDRTGLPRIMVHDELDFSDPGGTDEAFREMKHIMETVLPVSVPIRVEEEIGPNWGVTEKV